MAAADCIPSEAAVDCMMAAADCIPSEAAVDCIPLAAGDCIPFATCQPRIGHTGPKHCNSSIRICGPLPLRP